MSEEAVNQIALWAGRLFYKTRFTYTAVSSQKQFTFQVGSCCIFTLESIISMVSLKSKIFLVWK